MPAYCRGRVGTISHRTSEKWPFPDAIGHGRNDDCEEPTYHVQIAAEELFGSETDGGRVVVDLFEGYLRSAESRVGKERVSLFRSGWSPYHTLQNHRPAD